MFLYKKSKSRKAFLKQGRKGSLVVYKGQEENFIVLFLEMLVL
ncbi:hypothetical protein M23134_02689 [Microscilla marina ATCC 23134]|uniref:Uncharacterized protein n=1 Tax=Microscilla marina ATCC 23134 TaxID=313606 RepID=A1ZNY1_MICM2|nr:hypothetical protein M23134_02689 [Microscilla marina ATCC 23134]